MVDEQQKPPEFDYMTKTLVIDGSLQGELDKLIASKWEIMPGTKGVAIYHLMRLKEQQAPNVAPLVGVGPVGRLAIDDTRIHILRANGTIDPPFPVEQK